MVIPALVYKKLNIFHNKQHRLYIIFPKKYRKSNADDYYFTQLDQFCYDQFGPHLYALHFDFGYIDFLKKDDAFLVQLRFSQPS